MDNRIPVHNTTKSTMFLGGVMIPPDETRPIPAHHVPAHLRPKPVEVQASAPSAEEALLEILDHNIPEIVEMFGALSDDELAELEIAEQNGKTRSGLMKAFQEEKLRRAGRQAELDNYAGQLAAMDLEQLKSEREAVVDDAGKVGMIDELIAQMEGDA